MHLTRAYFARGEHPMVVDSQIRNGRMLARFITQSAVNQSNQHPHSTQLPAKGVLLVCDLTREKTFEAVRAWKKEIDEWALTETKAGVGPLPVVLIANKVHSCMSTVCRSTLPYLSHSSTDGPID